SNRGDRVLDPFLGSGSTLIAAEKTGRICAGIELDPRYVDVALARWFQLTGTEPVLAVTGEGFTAVAASRAEIAAAETRRAAAGPLDATRLPPVGPEAESGALSGPPTRVRGAA